MKVDRRQVVAFRMAAQGLHRTATAPADLAVTALGVQDTPVGTARLAIAARTTAELTAMLAELGVREPFPVQAAMRQSVLPPISTSLRPGRRRCGRPYRRP